MVLTKKEKQEARALELISKATEIVISAEHTLIEAAKLIAKTKGFRKENINSFAATFASGNETVVSFNGECEMADLDLRVMWGMTKNEIIDRLMECENSDETNNILLSEKE